MYAIRMVKISLILALTFSITGCPRSNVGHVEGIVTLDGEPVPWARVNFLSSAGQSAFGETDENGHYVMGFVTDGSDSGATVGESRVKIATFRRRFPENIPEILPSKYNTETELTVEVVPGSQTINWDLKTGEE